MAKVVVEMRYGRKELDGATSIDIEKGHLRLLVDYQSSTPETYSFLWGLWKTTTVRDESCTRTAAVIAPGEWIAAWVDGRLIEPKPEPDSSSNQVTQIDDDTIPFC